MTCLYKEVDDPTYCGREATHRAIHEGLGYTPVCDEHAETFRRTIAEVKPIGDLR